MLNCMSIKYWALATTEKESPVRETRDDSYGKPGGWYKIVHAAGCSVVPTTTTTFHKPVK